MARAGSAPGTPRYRLKGLIGAAAPSLYSMPLSACPSSVTEDVRPGESAPPQRQAVWERTGGIHSAGCYLVSQGDTFVGGKGAAVAADYQAGRRKEVL